MDSNTTPYWFEKRNSNTGFPKLEADLDVDLLIVGGGITGSTAAWLMTKAGYSVALVERQRIGARDTGHTTAHLTYMTDTRLSEVVATFSRDEARKAWEAGQAAMEFIASAVEELNIDCGLKKVPGYLAVAVNSDIQQESSLLNHETMVARQLGFDAKFIESDPATARPAMRLQEQMEFHPLLYVDALISAAVGHGAKIYEETELTEFTGEGEAKVGDHTIRFKKAFIATHVPLQGNASTLGAAMFQTKLALYSTYAIRAKLPGNTLPEMIWSDTADPFLYLRVQRDESGSYCILGGEDHKTGQDTPSAQKFENLEARLSRMIPGAQVTHRWSGQVIETVDGLPFIGPSSDSEFIATGFSGNGMTFGTIAAIMLKDWMEENFNPWAKLFDPSRRTASALGEYLRENKDFPVRLITDRMHVEEGDPAELTPGQAKILEYHGKRVAAHRAESGDLTVCSAVCPHMGCIVAWNAAEQTWDCPCHGSRFKACGEVIGGPAEKDLSPIEL